MAQLPAKKGADSLYYRRYLSDLNDGYINEGFKIQKKRKSDTCLTSNNEGLKVQKFSGSLTAVRHRKQLTD